MFAGVPADFVYSCEMARCEFERRFKVESSQFVRALTGGAKGACAQDRGSIGALLAKIVVSGALTALLCAHAWLYIGGMW